MGSDCKCANINELVVWNLLESESCEASERLKLVVWVWLINILIWYANNCISTHMYKYWGLLEQIDTTVVVY